MRLSLKHDQLSRYRKIARLLVKYGRRDIVDRMGLRNILSRKVGAVRGEKAPPEAAELADDLEEMGATFVKLGQLLSTRPDLIPLPYVQALARLQDDVEPFPFGQAKQIVEDELGVKISKAFRSFDSQPLASASLGQVHRAVTHDGVTVAVKVQRPGVREEVAKDLEALTQIAHLVDKHTKVGRQYQYAQVVDEFSRMLTNELDYRLEARNLRELAHNIAQFHKLVVPAPHDDYSTSRVLTMDYIHGRKITRITDLMRLELDGQGIADEVFAAYLHQILVDGFFHADPHPGNVFLTSDHRIALLDLGMVERFSPGMQENLLKLLLACAEGRGEDAAEVALQIGTASEDFDRIGFYRQINDLVAEHHVATVEHMNTGRLMMEIARACGENYLRVPPDIAVLGKTLMNLDEVAHSLAPQFNPNDSVKRHATQIMNRRFYQTLSMGSIFSGLLETKEFVEHLPGRVNKLLDQITQNEVRVRVDAIDEDQLLSGFQKIANRITVGLVIAALIIGAALMTSVPSDFRILGYPAVATILFFVAVAFGFGLVINILWHDRSDVHQHHWRK